jgi:uncharacterized lipoprotein YmbA
MTFLKTALVGTTLVLASCGAVPDRYTVATPAVTETLRIGFNAVEVSDVSLPTYAAADEIVVQDANGKLVPSGAALWADDPERSVALELARNLAKLSNARVASEPWPFEAFPDARLEVRFESLVAQADGQFRATGQYFVGVTDERRERSGLFDLTVPFDTTGGPKAVTQARGQIILDLAKYIARKGLK